MKCKAICLKTIKRNVFDWILCDRIRMIKKSLFHFYGFLMVVTTIFLSILILILMGMAWTSRAKIERFLFYVSGYFLGGDVQSRIALSTPVDRDIMTTVDGDLVTYLSIRGARRLIGTKDFNNMSEKLSDQMSIKLRDGTGKQHAFVIGFLSNPPDTPHLIHELMKGAQATAHRMGASRRAQHWFEEKERSLAELCNEEIVIMAIYTLKSGLTPKEAERYAQWMQSMREAVRKAGGQQIKGKPPAKGGEGADRLFNQAIVPVYPVLAARHNAMVTDFIESVENESGGIGVIVDKLHCDEAIYILRRFVDGSSVPPNWRPQLFGSQAPMGTSLRREGDLAHVMPLPIGRQVFSEPMIEDFSGMEVVNREGIWYGSLKLDVCPQENPAPGFSSLAQKVGKKFPYALTMEITPNGIKQKQMDQLFSSFFGGFGSHNRVLRDAWKELKTMDEEGICIAALRCVCTTWSHDKATLTDQLSTLKMALQSWGSTTVSNESGSPVNMLLATAPSLSRYNPAPFLPGPLSTFSRMMPMYRAASPWTQGQLLLRTTQGKPYPIAFGASNQAFWGTLVFAPPGRGKSFLMNCLNAGLLFSPGLSDLPYIVIIDKGMSSANVIEMARGILPDERKHQAVSIRLRNTAEYAINIFDTQLGMDMPTERERDFQVNMVSALCPNLGNEGARFIGQVIDMAFRNLDRSSLHAKRWQRALDPEITDKLLKHGMTIDDTGQGPRIWDVVDKLFDLGDVHLATRAQRFAVPILDDLITAANAENVQDLYGKTPTPSNEAITPTCSCAPSRLLHVNMH